jgi:hypothetical protein
LIFPSTSPKSFIDDGLSGLRRALLLSENTAEFVGFKMADIFSRLVELMDVRLEALSGFTWLSEIVS